MRSGKRSSRWPANHAAIAASYAAVCSNTLAASRRRKVEVVVVRGDRRQDARIVRRIDHRRHRSEVLRRGAQHARSTDVDLLDDFIGRDADARRRLPKRVQVDDDEVDRRDAVLGDRRHVLGEISPRQEPAVHRGMQGLHASVEHLGKAGHVGDVAYGDVRFTQGARGAAGRDELPAVRVQAASEFEQTGLVGDGEESARHWVDARVRDARVRGCGENLSWATQRSIEFGGECLVVQGRLHER
jgi:hypothetical protein